MWCKHKNVMLRIFIEKMSSWKSLERENVSWVTCRILGENVDIDFLREQVHGRMKITTRLRVSSFEQGTSIYSWWQIILHQSILRHVQHDFIMTNLRGQEEKKTPLDFKGGKGGRNMSREGNDPIRSMNAVMRKQNNSSTHEGNDRFWKKQILTLIQKLLWTPYKF